MATNETKVRKIFNEMRSTLEELENKHKYEAATAQGIAKLEGKVLGFITSPEFSSVPTADTVEFDQDVVQFNTAPVGSGVQAFEYVCVNPSFTFTWASSKSALLRMVFQSSAATPALVDRIGERILYVHPGSDKASVANTLKTFKANYHRLCVGNENIFCAAVAKLRSHTVDSRLLDAQRKLAGAAKIAHELLAFLASEHGARLPLATNVWYADSKAPHLDIHYCGKEYSTNADSFLFMWSTPYKREPGEPRDTAHIYAPTTMFFQVEQPEPRFQMQPHPLPCTTKCWPTEMRMTEVRKLSQIVCPGDDYAAAVEDLLSRIAHPEIDQTLKLRHDEEPGEEQ